MSIITDLEELEKNGLDASRIETAKKYQEYKMLLKPFWQTPTFLTIVISAISITITGILGFEGLIVQQRKDIKVQRDSIANAKTQLDSEKGDIQKLVNDTLKISALKASIGLTIESAKNQIANFKLIEVERKIDDLNIQRGTLKDANVALIKQQSTLADAVKTTRASYDELHNQVDTILFIKEKTDLLNLFYALKGRLPLFIMPLPHTFSAIFVKSSDIPYKERKDSLKALQDKIDSNRLLNKILITHTPIKKKKDNLKQEITQLVNKFSSNRYIYNSNFLFKKSIPT